VALVTHAAQTVPVRFEGIPYVRIGSATPRLDDHPDRERNLLTLLSATTFEDDTAVEHLGDEEMFELLDVEGALRLLGQVVQGNPATQLQQLSRFGVIEAMGGGFWSVSKGGAILFARDLRSFGLPYERKAPRVVHYVGETRVRTLREQTGQRGYAIAFEGLVSYIERQLPHREILVGVTRREQGVYPLVAVRELVANALVHQDLSIRGAGPMIELFDGRVEISNPGPPLVEVDRLLDEPPRSRNERIGRLMRQIGYCEERGSGIDKVITLAEEYQLPPPECDVHQQSFRATLYGPRGFEDMTTEERLRACYQHACLLWVAGRRPMTNSTLRERLGLPSNRAAVISRLFTEATTFGLIKRADPSNQSRAQASYVPYWA